MLEQTVQIVSNERDTDSYFRLVLRAPQIAPLIQPGQFAHVRVLPMKDALLRRPFSIFQVDSAHAYAINKRMNLKTLLFQAWPVSDIPMYHGIAK